MINYWFEFTRREDPFNPDVAVSKYADDYSQLGLTKKSSFGLVGSNETIKNAPCTTPISSDINTSSLFRCLQIPSTLALRRRTDHLGWRNHLATGLQSCDLMLLPFSLPPYLITNEEKGTLDTTEGVADVQ